MAWDGQKASRRRWHFSWVGLAGRQMCQKRHEEKVILTETRAITGKVSVVGGCSGGDGGCGG